MFQKYSGIKPINIITENIKKSSILLSKQMAKILLIEDDYSISTVYKIKLEHEGFECVQAYNGLEALKLLDTIVPDLILLDLKMPVMDGETFLGLFRKNFSDLHTPIIVLTNINSSEAPKTIWHHGIEDYIVKAHMTPSELVQRIQSTLANNK